jgi:Leucine-rich repeat (LRR) protein
MKHKNCAIKSFASLCCLLLLFIKVEAQHRIYTDVESALRNPLDVYELNLNPSYIPDSIKNRKKDPNVEYIYKSKGYRLTDLPDSMVLLKNLKRLNLVNNNFSEIPSVVYKITSLVELSAGGISVSGEIKNLVNLKKLDLSTGRIKELPKEIGLLNNLVELNLDGNILEDLPFEIAQLNNLRKLNLGSNHFKYIPECVKQLTMLKEIGLNGLKNVDFNDTINSLCALKNLELIDLGFNKLTKFPQWILCCSALKTLYLIDISFTTFPQDIAKLKRLEFIMVVNYDSHIPIKEKRKVQHLIPWCKEISIH